VDLLCLSAICSMHALEDWVAWVIREEQEWTLAKISLRPTLRLWASASPGPTSVVPVYSNSTQFIHAVYKYHTCSLVPGIGASNSVQTGNRGALHPLHWNEYGPALSLTQNHDEREDQ